MKTEDYAHLTWGQIPKEAQRTLALSRYLDHCQRHSVAPLPEHLTSPPEIYFQRAKKTHSDTYSKLMKLKIYYRKNLHMTPGKIAAQSVHAATGAGFKGGLPVAVLSASDVKFNDLKARAAFVVQDLGLTEVDPGTETALAIFEP